MLNQVKKKRFKVDKNYLISKKELEFSSTIQKVKVVRRSLMILIQTLKLLLAQIFYKRSSFDVFC